MKTKQLASFTKVRYTVKGVHRQDRQKLRAFYSSMARSHMDSMHFVGMSQTTQYENHKRAYEFYLGVYTQMTQQFEDEFYSKRPWLDKR